MKSGSIQLCLVILAITGIHAMKLINGNTIRGKVNTKNALQYAWAIQGKDSVIAAADNNGNFNIKVKPGTWKVFLHTKYPYKNLVIENVIVEEGNATNLGEIPLQHLPSN